MKKLAVLAALTLTVLLTGCVVPQQPSIMGALMTKNKKTVFVQNGLENFDYTKKGAATTAGVLGLSGIIGDDKEDCTMATAAKNGGVKNIKFAEQEYYSILMVYTKVTTTVYGE